MKSIKSILKTIDIFGEPFQLNIKHKLRSNTSLGGILTIITVLLISVVTLATGLEIFYKENPEVNNEDQLFLQRPNSTSTNTPCLYPSLSKMCLNGHTIYLNILNLKS
jgi:hypothetical protein